MLLVVLVGVGAHRQAARATSLVKALPATSFSNVVATFYPNPNDSGVFDTASRTTPAFTQPFSSLDFNPPASLQFCSNSTGIDENTRPFTNIARNADGSCTVTVAQGNNQQGQQHPVSNQYGCASTSDSTCLTVTSTNQENGNE